MTGCGYVCGGRGSNTQCRIVIQSSQLSRSFKKHLRFTFLRRLKQISADLKVTFQKSLFRSKFNFAYSKTFGDKLCAIKSSHFLTEQQTSHTCNHLQCHSLTTLVLLWFSQQFIFIAIILRGGTGSDLGFKVVLVDWLLIKAGELSFPCY